MSEQNVSNALTALLTNSPRQLAWQSCISPIHLSQLSCFSRLTHSVRRTAPAMMDHHRGSSRKNLLGGFLDESCRGGVKLISIGRPRFQVEFDNIGGCKGLHTAVSKVNNTGTHLRLDEACRNQSSGDTRYEPIDFAFQLEPDIDGKSSASVELQWPGIASRWS